jgi:hypothetical protein
MNFGFNSDVPVGAYTCHVQTEERGIAHPVIETVVYLRGCVLYRRAASYEDLLGEESNEAAIRERVEEQHRSVIEELRSGVLVIPAADLAAAASAGGIQVHLLNPASWVAAGKATLEIEVLSRADGRPVGEARLEIMLEGSRPALHFTGQSDAQGRAQIAFLLPALDSAGAELIIRAMANSAEDQIRYALRPKGKSPAPAGGMGMGQ